jgi:hypothetical protein
MSRVTVMEIREEYEALKTSLLTETYSLAVNAAAHAEKVSIPNKDRLSEREVNGMWAAEAEAWAERERTRLRTASIDLHNPLRAGRPSCRRGRVTSRSSLA